MTQQPEWTLLGQLDPEWIDDTFGSVYLLYKDEYDVYCPEMEYLVAQLDGTFLCYRFEVERYKIVGTDTGCIFMVPFN